MIGSYSLICNTHRKNSTYIAHIFVVLAIFLTGCALPKATPFEYSDDFVSVQEAVLKRDGLALLALTNSTDSLAASAAWRALASTPSAPTDSVLAQAMLSSNELGWFALSTRELSSDQLRILESIAAGSNYPPALIRTLGLQGDVQTASLLDVWASSIEPGSSAEPVFALAMSMIQVRRIMETPNIHNLVKRALHTPNAEAARNWLYAIYRSPALVLDSAAAASTVALLDTWQTTGDTTVRRYLARALAKSGRTEALDLYDPSAIPGLDVNSAVDLVRILPYFKDNLPQEHIAKLFDHENPVVLTALLDLLADTGYTSYVGLDTHVEEIIESRKTSDPRLFIKANTTRLRMPGGETYTADRNALMDLANRHPYFASDALSILIMDRNTNDVLADIQPFANSDDHLKRMAAASAIRIHAASLANTSSALTDRQLMSDRMWTMLENPNRGVLSTLYPMLRNDTYRSEGDNDRMITMLKSYRLPEDVEVYQIVLPSLLSEMGVEAQHYADSIAGYGVPALNRILVDHVSDSVKATIENAPSSTIMQGPDWAMLKKLGLNPQLQLETEIGLIVIDLDPLRAPATVSALVRLAEAGSYNGVAFHRVVPNFVIQGGDIESGDGYGGPDFTIPNEPSEQSFTQGAAGIASAGKDTEGSQYFMMMDWAPHLDGGYTIFGRVVQGQDVIDRIRVGDKVIRARGTNL